MSKDERKTGQDERPAVAEKRGGWRNRVLLLALCLWPGTALAQTGTASMPLMPKSVPPVDADQLDRDRGQGLGTNLPDLARREQLGVVLWDEYRKMMPPPAKDGALPATEVIVLPLRQP